MLKKHERYKYLKRFFYIFIIIYIIIMIFNSIASSLGYNEETKVADGFEISSYNVILDVKEDNKINVTENITVDFTVSNKHGIYKFTPLWLEYTGKDGKTIKRKSLISNLRSPNEKYSVDTVNKKARIRLGDENEFVGLNEKTYTIEYTYNMGKDPYKGFDEFIFHAYGDEWGTEIKNATLEVRMPKKINKDNINFYLDKYRENPANSYVDYTVNGNTIYAKFNQEKYTQYLTEEYCSDDWHHEEDGSCTLPYYYEKVLDNALTIDIELEEGYFTGGTYNYGYISLIISIIILGITIWHFIRWLKYGKDFPKRVETVEFYPPENYDAAEIGYIYGKQANKKLTIALIIQLASKGYIKIDDLKTKKDNIQITNLVPKNESSNNLEPLSKLEKKVYDRLFTKEDVIILSKHKTFYKVFDDVEEALDKKFKDLLNDKVASNKFIKSIFITIIVFILSLVSYFVIEDLDPNLSIFYNLSFLCILINIFLTIIMKRKTKYAQEIIAKVKGFRNFLITAEKENLEALVNENPNYFYNILPYTYVLGVSKKWISKFEDIPLPETDMGTYDYYNTSSLNSIYNDIYYPESSSSSSSSCGGGCSSCGGGCSSCGGGGSW